MDEIEIRGKVDEKEFKELEAFLNKNAEFIDHYDRLTVDISPGFDPKTRNWSQINDKSDKSQIDLRLKKSGKAEKISVKIGHYASKKREEFEIDIKGGEFVDALKLFEALGFKNGMIYQWKSWIYKYQGFEIKISEYPNSHHEWEIESQNSENDPNDLAKTLNLKPFTEEEFKEYINWKNNNLHEIYSLEKVSEII